MELQRFLWPGVTHESLFERPFHVYDAEFLDIIGKDPGLTLLATSEKDPLFHEAVVWFVDFSNIAISQARLTRAMQVPAH